MALMSVQSLCLERDVASSQDPVKFLESVSFELNAGELLTVIGPNGAGKSTLLSCLAGDITPSSGGVLLNAKSLTDYLPAERARCLAVLPQHSVLQFPFSVREVVRLGRLPHSTGNTIDEEIVTQSLAELDITYLAERPFTQLSGGEQQRVQLARVMVQIWSETDFKERILLLDEPCAGLDVAHVQKLMRFLKKFVAQGVGVVMTLHDFNVAARYSDSIMALKSGRVVAYGSVQAVITQAHIEDIFSVSSLTIEHPDTGHPIVLVDG